LFPLQSVLFFIALFSPGQICRLLLQSSSSYQCHCNKTSKKNVNWRKDRTSCLNHYHRKNNLTCFATVVSMSEARSNKSQCIDGTDNQIPVSSSVRDLMHADGTPSQTKDSNVSALDGQYKNRFSPLLTFHRRVKKKINSDEPAEEICSLDNNRQCSTLTCSPPSSSLNATPLLKHTAVNPLEIEDKVCFYLHLVISPAFVQ